MRNFQLPKSKWLRRVVPIVVLLLAIAGLAAANILAFDADKADNPDNSDILAAAYAIPDGGGYCDLSKSGVAREITHNGTVILSASKGGSYCCGFTFQVVMDVAKRRGLLNRASVFGVRQFQKEWYGATRASRVRQVAYALTEMKIGKEVPQDQGRPGDFIVFYRTNKTGHSAVFLNWMVDGAGRIVGIQYRSSQGRTKGVSDTSEFFSDSGLGDVQRHTLYVGRLNKGS